MEKKNKIDKKVLIVDDEEPTLNVFLDSFMAEGFTVFGAENGQVGLELALKEHPDMILLDINMPVMDGLTMINLLRDNDWGKQAQIMLLTNLSDLNKVAKATEKGVFDYFLKKDWKTEDIIKKVKEKLGV